MAWVEAAAVAQQRHSIQWQVLETSEARLLLLPLLLVLLLLLGFLRPLLLPSRQFVPCTEFSTLEAVLCFLEWSLVSIRAHGRPRTRWNVSLNKYFCNVAGTYIGSASWIALAQDRDTWKNLDDGYVAFCLRRKLRSV